MVRFQGFRSRHHDTSRDGLEVFRLSPGRLSGRVGGRMDGKGAAPIFIGGEV
jgi:hypothetical protein